MHDWRERRGVGGVGELHEDCINIGRNKLNFNCSTASLFVFMLIYSITFKYFHQHLMAKGLNCVSLQSSLACSKFIERMRWWPTIWQFSPRQGTWSLWEIKHGMPKLHEIIKACSYEALSWITCIIAHNNNNNMQCEMHNTWKILTIDKNLPCNYQALLWTQTCLDVWTFF
jgi:hypothetical protein